MKQLKALLMGVFALVLTVSSSHAQEQTGNPLKNIPVTDLTGVVSDATISIDDFYVVDDQVYVTSTLTGNVGGYQIVQTVSYPISILVSTCDQLVLLPGVIISEDNFQIANFSVNITATHSTDARLRAALCSIAELQDSNVSPYVLVAKIKQATRALIQ
jgi:hypothetical protein